MGALGGGIGLRRFRVRGDLPRDLGERFAQALNLRAFTPVDPRGDEDRSAGWVTLHDAERTEFAPGDFLFNEYVAATFRIDTLRVPRAAVQTHLRRRLAELKAELGREPERRERKLAEQEVALALRKQVLPSTRTIDYVWNLKTGWLAFWGTSNAAVTAFCEIFTTTFALDVEPLGPAAMAAEAAGQERADALERLVPSRPLVEGFFASE